MNKQDLIEFGVLTERTQCALIEFQSSLKSYQEFCEKLISSGAQTK